MVRVSDSRVIVPHAVDRPALRALLDIGVRAPLVVIVAPAGYGKSVLLAQWAQSRPDLAIAWLDITDADEDANGFAARLVRAITEADGRMTQPDAPVGTVDGGLGEPFLEALGTSLAQLGETVIVLDDLHHVSASPITADLWRLADLLPPNAHLVFSTRTDSRIGRSRHRLQHGLVELRQAQLAFDDDDAALLLERITGRAVPRAAAEIVVRHTEGWAAGVQLSALTMRFEADFARFADRLDETDRLIVEYLSEEVLEAQTLERRTALLRLAALDEITSGLAEAVTGLPDGERFLADLVTDSMFLIPIADRRGSYRFHHLFRDLLRYRLRVADPGEEARLLVVAADWHLVWGDHASAVEYLLRAREWDRVFALLLASGREVYDRVRTTTVARWLSLVPENVRAENVDVQMLYAIVAGMSGRAALTVEILQDLLGSGRLDIGRRQVALAYLSAGAQFMPHPEFFVDRGAQALAALAEHVDAPLPVLLQLTQRPLLETLAMTSMGRAHFFAGQLEAARAVLTRSLHTDGAHYITYRVSIIGSLALTEAWRGQLQVALDLAAEALELARENDLLTHPAPADAYLARAVASVRQGRPEAGAVALHEGAVRAAANQRTQLMWIAQIAGMMIDPDRSDPVSLDPSGPPPPLVRRTQIALEWRAARLRGRPRSRPATPEKEWSVLAFEHVAASLAQGEARSARELLAASRADPESLSPISRIERGIATAWLCALDGRAVESRIQLEAALDLAERDELVQVLVAAGPFVANLIASLPSNPSAFRRRIIDQVNGSRRRPAAELAEPLTARELEILVLLPSRLTNNELAARYYVSVNTVKTHIAHIYRKLGVTGRDAAVERARDLGLIAHGEIARTG